MTQPDLARLAGLVERLREQVASGHFTQGGGSISFGGKGEMWGGEPIMVARNPDGSTAATEIEALLAHIAALEEALEKISNQPDTGLIASVVEAKRIARNALTLKSAFPSEPKPQGFPDA